MTEEQIFSVLIKNGCIAVPSECMTEWYLNKKVCSWNDKIGAVIPSIKKMVFGEGVDNVVTFDDLTPELIEEKINLVRKKEKLFKINERLKDLEKDFD